MKNLLSSKQFWVTLIALFVIIVAAFVPGFEIDQARATDYMVIAVAYVIGVTVDPGPGGWKGVLQSRKFWAAVLGFLVLILDGFHIVLPFDLSVDQLTAIALTLSGYIVSAAIQPAPKEPEDKLPAYGDTYEG